MCHSKLHAYQHHAGISDVVEQRDVWYKIRDVRDMREHNF